MNEINKTFTNKIEDIFLKNLNQNKNDDFLKNNSQKIISKKSSAKKISIDIANKNINNFLENNIAVAVSGGCDSLALLMLIVDYFLVNKNYQITLHILTIDHKIRKNSSSEAKKLQKLLKDILQNFPSHLKFHHRIIAIPKNKIPQKNIEAKLRELRYQIMIDYCKKNLISSIFLGHHLGDIAENFLIRLFRGSSIEGLSSINEINEIDQITLIRPLLNFHKNQLKEYLISKNISWFEDETNDDEKFLRNKIRNFLASFPDENLLQNRLKNTADYFLKMREFFDEKTHIEKSRITQLNPDGSWIIDHHELKKLPQELALKIVGEILISVGKQIYKPRREKLLRFYEYIFSSDKLKPRNFYRCMLKQVNDQQILIFPENNKIIN
jgi:tRNA(Ile)-lysidine synthase